MQKFIVLATNDETQEVSYYNGAQFVAEAADVVTFATRREARYIQGVSQSRMEKFEVSVQSVTHSISIPALSNTIAGAA